MKLVRTDVVSAVSIGTLSLLSNSVPLVVLSAAVIPLVTTMRWNTAVKSKKNLETCLTLIFIWLVTFTTYYLTAVASVSYSNNNPILFIFTSSLAWVSLIGGSYLVTKYVVATWMMNH